MLFPVNPDPHGEGPGLFAGEGSLPPPTSPYRVACPRWGRWVVEDTRGVIVHGTASEDAAHRIAGRLNEAFRDGWMARERAGGDYAPRS